MTSIPTKDELFDDFFCRADHAFDTLENLFGVERVKEQLFGPRQASEDDRRARLRRSQPWATLSALHEYAVHGVEGDEDALSIVYFGADVLNLTSTEIHPLIEGWEQVLAMADGRHGLDEGDRIDIRKVALLANVDIRTVRNAISAGELVAHKSEDGVLVENASARNWLVGRKGFTPTARTGAGEDTDVDRIVKPLDFGAFLRSRRERLGLDAAAAATEIRHPAVDAHAVARIEAGTFPVPLDAVFPLADGYRLARKPLLDCVMRVFFNDELEALRGTASRDEG
jgi:hypothetical protein